MREAYIRLYDFLREKDWVGSALVYKGPKQGVQFLWQEHGILWAPPEETKFAEKAFCEIQQVKSGTACQLGENHIFVERIGMYPRLVIFGGGHISLSLVKLGKMLGFHVTVADDREEFANPRRFPEADRVLCGSFERIFEEIPDLPANYYVVVTRGHQADELCVRQILRRKYAYLGMIGSRSKVAKTKETLAQYGFSHEKIEEIHAPIGLKIGAVTPEEIAVSIAAEIIQEKNSVLLESFDERIWRVLREEKEMVMALIVKKAGSAPRAAGARMLIGEENRLTGTIGGGAVEYAAAVHGREMIERGIPYDLREFVLRQEEGAELGMVCGGSNLIFFEKL